MKEKIKKNKAKTFLEKYNATSPFGSSEIREKQKKTMIEKYGYDHNFKDPKLRKKLNNLLKLKKKNLKCEKIDFIKFLN